RRPSRRRPGVLRAMTRLAGRVETAGERGLFAGGGVAVDHALADGLVERADPLLYAGALRGARAAAGQLHGGAHLRAHGAVAQPTALVLAHPFHGRLRVRHPVTPPGSLSSPRRA